MNILKVREVRSNRELNIILSHITAYAVAPYIDASDEKDITTIYVSGNSIFQVRISITELETRLYEL